MAELTETEKQALYREAVEQTLTASSVAQWEEVAEAFVRLGDYADAPALREDAEHRAEKARLRIRRREANKGRNRKIALIAAAAVAVVAIVVAVVVAVVNGNHAKAYAEAEALVAAGRYGEALELLEPLCQVDYTGAEQLQAMALAMQNYATAQDLMAAGDYAAAADVFAALGGFRDAEEQAAKAAALAETARIEPLRVDNGAMARAAVGDIVYLGSYEQDNVAENGPEPIAWRVLDIQEGKALLVSVYALDRHEFNTETTNDWETCSLRLWLEGTFQPAAFTAAEQAYLAEPVTLLTLEQASTLFADSDDRVCYHTEYARVAIKSKDVFNGCFWWLRSPGGESWYATAVWFRGDLNDMGNHVCAKDYAVRPAIWVTL